MPLTRISKNLIEIFMRSNFAMKFSALLQMVETLILTSSKSYVDIIDQKYNIFRAYGYLLANVEDFCRQKNNSTTYEVNVGDIINTIQEDIYNPGALLAVVISSSKTSKPNSRLLRIYRNGDKEWVAGVSVNWVDNYHSFPWISSFFQLSRTIILIADSKLRCIRSVETSSGEVHTYSGNCSNQQIGRASRRERG